MKTTLTTPRFLLPLLLLTAFGSSLRAQNHATFTVSGLTFTRPAKWEWVEPSGMRAAELKVTDAASKDPADVIFFQFGPGAGGNVQANIDRWLAQFSEPKDKLNSKVEETTVGKTKITYVQAEGTFKSGMPGQSQEPKSNYGLLGAIFPAGGGNSIFIKMTGPKDLVKTSTADFKKMVESGLK